MKGNASQRFETPKLKPGGLETRRRWREGSDKDQTEQGRRESPSGFKRGLWEAPENARRAVNASHPRKLSINFTRARVPPLQTQQHPPTSSARSPRKRPRHARPRTVLPKTSSEVQGPRQTRASVSRPSSATHHEPSDAYIPAPALRPGYSRLPPGEGLTKKQPAAKREERAKKKTPPTHRTGPPRPVTITSEAGSGTSHRKLRHQAPQ